MQITKLKTVPELVDLVTKWCDDRHINAVESNTTAQKDKKASEVGEFIYAMALKDIDGMVDSVGDAAVCLVASDNCSIHEWGKRSIIDDLQYAAVEAATILGFYGRISPGTSLISDAATRYIGDDLKMSETICRSLNAQTPLNTLAIMLAALSTRAGEQLTPDPEPLLRYCLSKAYDEIKDRKGRMINGQFVKEQ